MKRQDLFKALLLKLKERQIYEIKDELEEFLQDGNDQFTKKLQEAISKKLDCVPFPYHYFDDFLSDYQKNNLTDPSGYSDFYSRINGEN